MRLASATESAIAATYAGEFRGTLASFRAAKIAEQIAMTADLRGSSTNCDYATFALYSPQHAGSTDQNAGLHDSSFSWRAPHGRMVVIIK
jgi:hypothetical protein